MILATLAHLAGGVKALLLFCESFELFYSG